MCRQTMLLGVAVCAIGVGLLLAAVITSGVVQVLLALALIGVGFCITRKP